MLKVHDNWIKSHQNIHESFFQKYDEETGLVKNDEVDYKINDELYKKWELQIYVKKNMPVGSMSQGFFRRGRFIYSMLGMSHACGGPHKFPFKATGNPAYGGNNIFRYDLENDKWDNLGKLKSIKPIGGMLNWVYNDKFYLLGGYSFQKADPQFLEEYQKKYGKWPEKKGEWYSSDLREITITENDEIYEKDIPLEMFTNTIMSRIQIGNRLYFIGGVNGRLQKCWLTSNELSYYIKDKSWKDKFNKMGEKIYLGSFLFYLDMENIDEGLQIESFYPGIPCMNYELVKYEHYIYLFSSHTYTGSHWSSFRPREKNRLSCPDNWKYNLETQEWIRLNDWPLRALCSKKVINAGKYAFICGGNNAFMETSIDYLKEVDVNFTCFTIDNYKEMINKIPEKKFHYEQDVNGRWFCKGDIEPFFKFGSISNKFSYFNEIDQKTVTSLEKVKSYDYFQHYFSDLIMFYDFKEDKYYFSNYNLPMNIAATTSKHTTYDNSVYLFGGESNDILLNNKFPMISSCLVLEIKCDEFNMNSDN
jgi:hypothetical protein